MADKPRIWAHFMPPPSPMKAAQEAATNARYFLNLKRASIITKGYTRHRRGLCTCTQLEAEQWQATNGWPMRLNDHPPCVWRTLAAADLVEPARLNKPKR